MKDKYGIVINMVQHLRNKYDSTLIERDNALVELGGLKTALRYLKEDYDEMCHSVLEECGYNPDDPTLDVRPDEAATNLKKERDEAQRSLEVLADKNWLERVKAEHTEYIEDIRSNLGASPSESALDAAIRVYRERRDCTKPLPTSISTEAFFEAAGTAPPQDDGLPICAGDVWEHCVYGELVMHKPHRTGWVTHYCAKAGGCCYMHDENREHGDWTFIRRANKPPVEKPDPDRLMREAVAHAWVVALTTAEGVGGAVAPKTEGEFVRALVALVRNRENRAVNTALEEAANRVCRLVHVYMSGEVWLGSLSVETKDHTLFGDKAWGAAESVRSILRTAVLESEK